MRKLMRQQVWATKGDFIYGRGYKHGNSWVLWACRLIIKNKLIDYPLEKRTKVQPVEYRTTIFHGSASKWREAQEWLEKECPDAHIIWSTWYGWEKDLLPGVYWGACRMEDRNLRPLFMVNEHVQKVDTLHLHPLDKPLSVEGKRAIEEQSA